MRGPDLHGIRRRASRRTCDGHNQPSGQRAFGPQGGPLRLYRLHRRRSRCRRHDGRRRRLGAPARNEGDNRPDGILRHGSRGDARRRLRRARHYGHDLQLPLLSAPSRTPRLQEGCRLGGIPDDSARQGAREDDARQQYRQGAFRPAQSQIYLPLENQGRLRSGPLRAHQRGLRQALRLHAVDSEADRLLYRHVSRHSQARLCQRHRRPREQARRRRNLDAIAQPRPPEEPRTPLPAGMGTAAQGHQRQERRRGPHARGHQARISGQRRQRPALLRSPSPLHSRRPEIRREQPRARRQLGSAGTVAVFRTPPAPPPPRLSQTTEK